MKNNLENLELKLAQTKKENAKKLDKIDAKFKKEFSGFLDTFLKGDNLGFKRYILVDFQLERLDNLDKTDLEILKNSFKKALEVLPLSQEKKEVLEKKFFLLLSKNKLFEKIFLKNNDLRKDKNYPILKDLKKHWFLDENDLIQLSLKYKETHNFLDSISVLSDEKKEIVKHNYFELNNTKIEDRIKNFENDFKQEIKNSKLLKIYPKIIRFIGKNYFKLKLKNKIESKKDRLRRLYKIAFLKLYRLKYSGIDIDKILQKIDTLEDFDDFINLIIKYFEVLKQNPNLQKDYIVSEEVEDVENILNEAEKNKEKILTSEKNTIKVNEIFEKHDKKITENNLEELLSDSIDLVWKEFVNRNNAWIYADFNQDLEESEDELLDEDDLEKYYENLKKEYEELEKKKQKLFLEWKYDELDNLNEELLKLLTRLEKLEKLLWLEDFEEK